MALNLKDIGDKYRRLKKPLPTDLVCLDMTATGITAVHMKKDGDTVTVLGAELLPLIDATAERHEHQSLLNLSPKLKARYASITTAGESAIIKLLSFPGAFDANTEAKVVENLGVDNPDNFRISYKLLTEEKAKECKVLAVALPAAEANAAMAMLETGLPAPHSLEIAGIAALTAFANYLGSKRTEESCGVIDFGTQTTSFALFNKGVLTLLRRFTFGSNAVLNKVRETLGVDLETAQGIIADGAFDISQSVSEVMDPVVKQLIVSRDFVERRENCHVAKMYVSGALVVSRDALDEIRTSMGIEVLPWNPLEKMNVAPDAIAASLVGQEWRLSPAIGAGLATFEET